MAHPSTGTRLGILLCAAVFIAAGCWPAYLALRVERLSPDALDHASQLASASNHTQHYQAMCSPSLELSIVQFANTSLALIDGETLSSRHIQPALTTCTLLAPTTITTASVLYPPPPPAGLLQPQQHHPQTSPSSDQLKNSGQANDQHPVSLEVAAYAGQLWDLALATHQLPPPTSHSAVLAVLLLLEEADPGHCAHSCFCSSTDDDTGSSSGSGAGEWEAPGERRPLGDAPISSGSLSPEQGGGSSIPTTHQPLPPSHTASNTVEGATPTAPPALSVRGWEVREDALAVFAGGLCPACGPKLGGSEQVMVQVTAFVVEWLQQKFHRACAGAEGGDVACFGGSSSGYGVGNDGDQPEDGREGGHRAPVGRHSQDEQLGRSAAAGRAQAADTQAAADLATACLAGAGALLGQLARTLRALPSASVAPEVSQLAGSAVRSVEEAQRAQQAGQAGHALHTARQAWGAAWGAVRHPGFGTEGTFPVQHQLALLLPLSLPLLLLLVRGAAGEVGAWRKARKAGRQRALLVRPTMAAAAAGAPTGGLKDE